MRFFSYGGGVQSTAALVLAAQGKIDYRTFLFANVGEDSESPDTINYVANYSIPFAKEHNLELITLTKKMRNGEQETVYQRIMRTKRSVPIPAKLSGGVRVSRVCTVDFKIRVCYKWVRQHGATKEDPATVGIGFSLDEYHRIKTDDPKLPAQRKVYPLIDLHLTRQDCENIVLDAGLPRPPKSACYFCPFHSPMAWQLLRINHPELYAKSVWIEKLLSSKGHGSIYLHSSMIPLDKIGIQDVFEFDEMGNCESGYCMV